MCNAVNPTPRRLRSGGRRRTFLNRLCLQAILLQIGLTFFSIPRAGADDRAQSTATVEDGFAARKEVVDRISELDAEAFSLSGDGGIAKRGANMQQAADLAKTTFGERHWLTRLKQSLADGLKSVADLPMTQQELFLEALNSNATGCAFSSQGKRDLALKGLRRAHD